MTRPSIRILQILAAGAAVAFLLLPIAYLLSVSFKRQDDVLTGAFLPQEPTLANWPAAFEATSLATFIVNSVVISVLAGLVTIAITLPAAYAMIRLGIGRKFLPQATLASYIAPPVVGLIPFFFLLKTVGLLNTHAGLILIYGFLNIPVAFWLLAPFLSRVPLEIEEAAALDGASRLRTLVSVVAPMIAPGIAATLIIVIILSFNEYLLASGLTLSDGMRTLTVGISLFQGDRLVNFGQIAAASLAGILPIYVIALVMQRHLVEGLAHGGVK
ncbi:MAG: carbohydrate ABC transporter permease [Candidatus Kaistia colombiensis]|nr:MAG: carbohydrate ABC transporter permease [Kaistia sp.]